MFSVRFTVLYSSLRLKKKNKQVDWFLPNWRDIIYFPVFNLIQNSNTVLGYCLYGSEYYNLKKKFKSILMLFSSWSVLLREITNVASLLLFFFYYVNVVWLEKQVVNKPYN